MDCPRCRTRNAANRLRCSSCGRILRGSPEGTVVPSHLVLAILATILPPLLCCSPLGVPFGVVSIVHAAKVDGRVAAGDRAGALARSRKAKTWAWGAISSAAVWLALFAILLAFSGDQGV